MALLGSGCTRKAPGPHECRVFAYRALGLDPNVLVEVPQARLHLDELTRQCLTTPYDRELLRCVDATGQSRACLLQFQRRQRADE